MGTASPLQSTADSGHRRPASRRWRSSAKPPMRTPWRPEFATEIRHMRTRLEENASKRNLKRGPGGTVDTEFLVQMLQLKHGGADASIRVPGTLDALTALEHGGYLSTDDADYFARATASSGASKPASASWTPPAATSCPRPIASSPSSPTCSATRIRKPLSPKPSTFSPRTRSRFNQIFEAAERS